MVYSETTDDEDAEAKHYANIYYVDTQTIECPLENTVLTPTNNQTKRFISRRYWSKVMENNPTDSIQINDTHNKVNRQYVNNKIDPANKNDAKNNHNVNPSNNNESVKIINQAGPDTNISEVKKNNQPDVDKNDSANQKNSSIANKNTNNSINDGRKSSSLIDKLVVPVPFTKSPKNIGHNNKQSVSKTVISEDSDDSGDREVTIVIPNYGLHKAVTKINETRTNKNNSIVNKTFPQDKSARNVSGNNTTMNSKNEKESSDDVIIVDISDSESVIEVEIKDPPKTAICIDSSDDEVEESESEIIAANFTPTSSTSNAKSKRPVCVSPVPSLVSTASDDFIQSDCTHLNISSKENSSFVFDFKLHGSDFGNNVSSKDANVINKKGTALNMITSTPVQPRISEQSANNESVFLTPKNKEKRKRKTKSYTLPDETLAAPFTDIYDSESSDVPESVADSVIDLVSSPMLAKKRKLLSDEKKNAKATPKRDTLVMANVIGIDTSNAKAGKSNNSSISDKNTVNECPTYVRKHTINNKATEKECVEDMERFYNESWGGENFDHNKIKMAMPNDKDLWKIDLADKFSHNKTNRKMICQVCNKIGHREEKCNMKVKVCHMCGQIGHVMNRCPRKICLNCGSSNNDYSSKCRKCNNWKRLKCSICHVFGHPTSNCPDLWRRYHLTHKNEIPLVSLSSKKPNSELYCSGCAKRGHIVNDCMSCDEKYKGATPFICMYTPSYVPDGVRDNSNDLNENILPAVDNDQSNRKKKSSLKCTEMPTKRIRLEDDSSDVIVCDSPSLIDNELFASVNAETSSKMLLTPEFYNQLASPKGIISLKNFSDKYKVDFSLESTLQGETLVLNGTGDRIGFQRDIQIMLISSEVHDAYLNNVHTLIPNFRSVAIKKLRSDLDSLNKNLGNPNDIYFSFKELEEKYKSSYQSTLVNMRSNIFLFKEMSDRCQALNMILLGQHGLCDGKDHVCKLQDGVNTLKNLSSKYLNHNMKNNLGKSYAVIFSPVPRNDYPELIDRYMKKSAEMNLRTVFKKQGNKLINPIPLIRTAPKRPDIPDPISGFSFKTSIKKIMKALELIRSRFSKSGVKANVIHTKYAQDTFQNITKHMHKLMNNGLSFDLFLDIKQFSAKVHKYIKANPEYF